MGGCRPPGLDRPAARRRAAGPSALLSVRQATVDRSVFFVEARGANSICRSICPPSWSPVSWCSSSTYARSWPPTGGPPRMRPNSAADTIGETTSATCLAMFRASGACGRWASRHPRRSWSRGAARWASSADQAALFGVPSGAGTPHDHPGRGGLPPRLGRCQPPQAAQGARLALAQPPKAARPGGPARPAVLSGCPVGGPPSRPPPAPPTHRKVI